MKINYFKLFVICYLILPNQVVAQEDITLDELKMMSLDSLMTTEIVTASKQAEALHEAPGIVSIVTAEEINRFGANNLVEVLERVTSIYMTSSYLWSQNITSIRGNSPTPVDKHILVLINGRPIRETMTNGVNFPIYQSFPLSMIKQIEIIRGPGSVLYGSNAFVGVINIITKDEVMETGNTNITAKIGSFNTRMIESSSVFAQGDLTLGGAVKHLKTDGWNFQAFDEAGVEGSTDYGEENFSTFLFGNYANFTFNGLFANSHQIHLGGTPFWDANDRSAERIFLDLGYEHRFSDAWKLQSNLTYNQFEDRAIVPSGTSILGSEDLLLEVTNTIEGDKINWLLGGTVYFMSGESWNEDLTTGAVIFTGIEKYRETWYSLYGQAEYNYSDSLQFFAGGQMIKVTAIAEKFVPRIGAIYQFTSELGIKALYGEAFRAASQFESKLNVPSVILGNPNLTPETVTTLDLQLFYHTPDYQLTATYFNSSQQELILLLPSSDSTANVFANEEGIDFEGFELESKIVSWDDLLVIASLTYQINENNAGQENYTTVPNWMAKFGISYDFNDRLSVGLFNNYFSKGHDVSVKFPGTRYVNPEPDAFNLMTLNVNVNLGNWLDMDNTFMLTGYVYNLLDEDIYTAEFVRAQINSLPAKQGRGVYIGFEYQF